MTSILSAMLLRSTLVASLLTLAPGLPAEAGAVTSGLDLDSGLPPSPFIAEPGSGYREGARQFGIQLGAAFGTRALGATQRHDVGMVTVQYGRVFTSLKAPDRWSAGNWELLLEAFLGRQDSPSHAALAGVTSVFRYDFATGSKWVPYLEAGAGGTWSEIRDGDLSSDFEFNLLWGGGARWHARPRTSLTVGYRWFHVSNLGLSRPNKGIDAHVLLLGFSRAF